MQPVPTRISREQAVCLKCEKLLNSAVFSRSSSSVPTEEEVAKEKVLDGLYEEHMRKFHGLSK